MAEGGASASVAGRAAELACRAGGVAAFWRAAACCDAASSFRRVLPAFLLTTCGHPSQAAPRSASVRRVLSTTRNQRGVQVCANLNLDTIALYDACRLIKCIQRLLRLQMRSLNHARSACMSNLAVAVAQ